jgi:hypothetical protein
MTARSTPSMAPVLNLQLVPARIAQALRAGILTGRSNERSLRIGL